MLVNTVCSSCCWLVIKGILLGPGHWRMQGINIHITPSFILSNLMFSEYVDSPRTKTNIRLLFERSCLKYMFLTHPGQEMSDADILPAFEKLLGCLAYDRNMDMQPLVEVLARLLTLSLIPDFDFNLSFDFLGSESLTQYLERIDFDHHYLTTITREDLQSPAPHLAVITESFLYGVRVSQGFGCNDPSSQADNERSQRYSDKLRTYCSEYQASHSSVTSTLVPSERFMYHGFDCAAFLWTHYQCAFEDIEKGFVYHRLYFYETVSTSGIPIKFPVILCIFLLQGSVKSASVHIDVTRAREATMRRLVASICEGLPMVELFRNDPALLQSHVLTIMAEYFPELPYPVEIIRPYLHASSTGLVQGSSRSGRSVTSLPQNLDEYYSGCGINDAWEID